MSIDPRYSTHFDMRELESISQKLNTTSTFGLITVEKPLLCNYLIKTRKISIVRPMLEKGLLGHKTKQFIKTFESKIMLLFDLDIL